jgi:hypothetical protein
MAERGISDVVQEARSCDDRTHVAWKSGTEFFKLGVFANQAGCGTLAQGSANGGHLNGMREARSNEIMGVQGEYLSLIAKPAKRGAENNPIEVVLELCTGIKVRSMYHLCWSQALSRHEALPHGGTALAYATPGHVLPPWQDGYDRWHMGLSTTGGNSEGTTAFDQLMRKVSPINNRYAQEGASEESKQFGLR